ncbi:MAG TPA: tRNA pseudouridine(38-40) synthase TruA [Solibacterales bacterium]|nr:tRNA pseudouridine(38-40) synthase TruA [Bryobacterales bacterium]
MRRIKFTLAYDGTEYFGWQVQPNLPTIQGTVETALAEIEGAPVHVTASGRTDAGVHALAQVAAFDLTNPIPLPNLRKAVNKLLPPAIRVLKVEEADSDFHPIRHARSKIYEYRIYREESLSPFDHRYVHHHPYPLDVDAMIEMAPLIEGEHDFRAFAASDEKYDAGEPLVRYIYGSEVREDDDRLVYRVCGTGFLKHMVRNIVGTLLEVGKGNLHEEGLKKLLKPGPETGFGSAGPTVPPQGLFLVSVQY